MAGKAINIVGTRGTGKSTVLKEIMAKVPNKKRIIIYDINHEHTEFYENSFENFEDFTNCIKSCTNCLLVIEEATIFLNQFKQRDILEILIRARHTNNSIVMIWHSLRTLPRWIYDFSNFLILKKTNDPIDLVRKRFMDDRITDIFLDVNNNENRYYYKVLQYA